MKSFKHYNPTSWEEVRALLAEYGTEAALMAGGTDLLGVLKAEILESYPRAVINLKTIPGLDGIVKESGSFRIGALARLADLGRHPGIAEEIPILAAAANSVGGPELRNMATLGGNLCQETRCWYYRYPHSMGGRMDCYRKGRGPCHAVPGDNRYHAVLGAKKCFAVCPSDTAVALAALNGLVNISGPSGKRAVAVTEFYDVFGPKLEPGEIVTGVEVPALAQGAVQAYLKFRPRESIDFAVVSVAACLEMNDGVCQEARIILGGVAPGAYPATEAREALLGSGLDDQKIDAAAQAAVIGAKPLSRNGYKIDLIRALVRRALTEMKGSG